MMTSNSREPLQKFIKLLEVAVFRDVTSRSMADSTPLRNLLALSSEQKRWRYQVPPKHQ
jgi:hypothetical protein